MEILKEQKSSKWLEEQFKFIIKLAWKKFSKKYTQQNDLVYLNKTDFEGENIESSNKSDSINFKVYFAYE